MAQAEQERSQEQREASGSEAEQVQQFGAVFYITVAISAVFVLAGVFFTDPFSSALATVVGWITDYLGWLYMLMTSFFLGFAIWLALSRYGKIRLGQPDDRPEFVGPDPSRPHLAHPVPFAYRVHKPVKRVPLPPVHPLPSTHTSGVRFTRLYNYEDRLALRAERPATTVEAA
jgi:hypothetical protein